MAYLVIIRQQTSCVRPLTITFLIAGIGLAVSAIAHPAVPTGE
jgi:hypothetical protein